MVVMLPMLMLWEISHKKEIDKKSQLLWVYYQGANHSCPSATYHFLVIHI